MIHSMTMVDIKDYLTVPEFAKRAGVTDQAIRKAIADKRVKADKIGRQWLIRKSELDAYIADR